MVMLDEEAILESVTSPLDKTDTEQMRQPAQHSAFYKNY